MAEAGYKVVLVAECYSTGTKKHECKEVIFQFGNEDHWIAHADDGFAELTDDFDNYLWANGQREWKVSGVIETQRRAKPGEGGSFVKVY